MECAVGDTAKAIIADGRIFCTYRKKIALRKFYDGVR